MGEIKETTKEVKVYECSDGQTFYSKKEATAHEKKISDKKYNVTVEYSFIKTFEVAAKTEDEAINKAYEIADNDDYIYDNGAYIPYDEYFDDYEREIHDWDVEEIK